MDDVLYIAVGNNDSFFGLATTKMTYSLIYKLCEDGTIKYVGCSGSAYAYLLGVIELGILYVNYGKYNDDVIISKEWVNIVLEYGYEFKHLKDDWYAKGGMCGQFLMFNMKSGKVIGCHSYDDNVSASLFIN